MIITAIDPSGNFDEGKGTTGIIVAKWNKGQKWPTIEKLVSIKAIKYKSKQAYYNDILYFIPFSNVVVIEDFTLRPNVAKSLKGSILETVRLIAILETKCREFGLKCILQQAAHAKAKWTNKLLLNHKLIKKHGNGFMINEKKIDKHILDALRHLLYFIKKKKPK